MSDDTTLESCPPLEALGGSHPAPISALVVLWSRHQPERIGEVLLLAPSRDQAIHVLGRSQGTDSKVERPVALLRQRPGCNEDRGGLIDPALSRRQMLLGVERGQIWVHNVGRAALWVNDRRVTERCALDLGDLCRIDEQLLMRVEDRPRALPPLSSYPGAQVPAFGEPDPFGLVGESPRAWRLREDLAFVARRDRHALILGPSGTGKELVAKSIHQLSARSRHPLVSRNAATIPESLVAAELFGNARNYPNPGMPERQGLIGAADGGTLLLDEIGELSQEAQANLLRVLDGDGEYQRLGESGLRRSSLRLLAATNRAPGELKSDFAARFALQLTVPGLNHRRSDIPLIARHLLRRIADNDSEIGARLFADGSSDALLPLTPRLLETLVSHHYSLHVRELESLLWTAIHGTRGPWLDLCEAVEARLETQDAPETSTWSQKNTNGAQVEPPNAEAIRHALERHGGNKSRASRELGLSSRYVLYRLMKTLGIDDGGGED